MGFRDAGDAAVDVTYSTKADGAGKMKATITTKETQYGVGEGGEGLLIGVKNSGDTAADEIY